MLRTEPISTQINYLEIQLTQFNPLFNLIEPNQPSQTQLILLRFKNSPYTVSIICIRNREKKQRKLTFIFSNLAKPSSQFFKTQPTQLQPT